MSKTARELLSLPQNWDSYHSDPITEEAVKVCESIEYIPLSGGGIEIELHTPKVDVEIEINHKGVVLSVFTEYKTI